MSFSYRGNLHIIYRRPIKHKAGPYSLDPVSIHFHVNRIERFLASSVVQ